jgi:hypothetical protein
MSAPDAGREAGADTLATADAAPDGPRTEGGTAPDAADARPDLGADATADRTPDAADGPLADGPIADAPLADAPLADGPVADAPSADIGQAPDATGDGAVATCQTARVSPFACAHCGDLPAGNAAPCGPEIYETPCRPGSYECSACELRLGQWSWVTKSRLCDPCEGQPPGCMPPKAKCMGAFIADADCDRCGEPGPLPGGERFWSCPDRIDLCRLGSAITMTVGSCALSCEWGYCYTCTAQGWQRRTLECPVAQ